MAVIRNGPNNPIGFAYSPEFHDLTCVISLANGATLAQGQVVCRAPATTPSANGADVVVLPNASNAQAVYGVYQGTPITNNTGATQLYPIEVRKFGYGVVLAGAAAAGTAVTVDGQLITTTGQSFAIQGSAALSICVGVAAPTGATIAHGGTLVSVPGSGTTTLLTNAYIDIK